MFDELIKKEDLAFFTSGSYFISGAAQFNEGMKDYWITYDVFIRNLPTRRNYLVFSGLENIIDYLTSFKLSKVQLKFLKKNYDFSSAVMNYYKNLRFVGELYAIPEGTIFFADEPVLRITAPIIDAQIYERYLINRVMVYTTLATKMSRFVNVANPIKTGVNFTRSHGIEAANIALRSAKIVGVKLASLPYVSQRLKIGTDSGFLTHSFVTSFDTEEAALRAYCRHCKGKGWWLVDTYDTVRGLKIYIKVVLERKKKKLPYPPNVIIDSGDLVKQSKIARKMLDRSGLKKVQIMLVSNLNEYKLVKMKRQNPAVDIYVGGEELTTSPDAPKLEVVHKMSELITPQGTIPKMKLSNNKVSLPGRKQVFRQSKKGRYYQDIIGLDKEKIAGKKLLVPIIKKGKLVYNPPSLNKINRYYQAECKKFNPSLPAINQKIKYPVKISPQLKSLAKKTALAIKKVHYDL